MTMGSCGCGSGSLYFLYPCSGASDTGEITDRTARLLTRSGQGRMSCLAQIGAGNEALIDAASRVTGLLALDGYAQDCAKKMLEARGLTNILHLRVTDLGLPKGQSPATRENIEKVANAALGLMPASNNTNSSNGGCCG
jgi:uncharacterized metal-binding protein